VEYNETMKAVILAGGKGTRLKPYTTILPKPLMPIGDVPILEIILKQLKYYGFHEIVLALGHKARYISTFFGDGKKFGCNNNILIYNENYLCHDFS